MKPLISIIIPCYNSEETLEQTLKSVFNQNYDEWEAIMVNDGSPDNLETIALKWVGKDSRFKYYKKENGGLGSARNYGVEKALGTYILPLDSDNMIRPDFVLKAINIMDAQKKLGVVYGDVMCFGDKNERWYVGEFSLFKMLNHNFIDACAVIRKKLFDEVGDYDENLPYQGHEDWDFWLRVLKTGYKFYYLNEVTFDYRVSESSMIKSFSHDMMQENINYIKQKHYDLYVKAYHLLLNENEYLKRELSAPLIKKVINRLKKIVA